MPVVQMSLATYQYFLSQASRAAGPTPFKLSSISHHAIYDLYLLRGAGVRVKHVNGVLPEAGRVAVWVEVDQQAVAAYNMFKAAHGIYKDEVAVSTGPLHRHPSPVVILIIKFDGSLCCFTPSDMATVLAEFLRHANVVVVKHYYVIKNSDVMAYLRVEPQFPANYGKAYKEEASELAARIANSSNPALGGQTINLGKAVGVGTMHTYQIDKKRDVYIPSPPSQDHRRMPCNKCRQNVCGAFPGLVYYTLNPYSVHCSSSVVRGRGPPHAAQDVKFPMPPPA